MSETYTLAEIIAEHGTSPYGVAFCPFTYTRSDYDYTNGEWTSTPVDPRDCSSLYLSDLLYFSDLLYLSDTAATEEHVNGWLVNVTGAGDYGGSNVERSNFRSLQRDFPNVFVPVSGSFGYDVLAILADDPRHDTYDADAMTDLVQTLVKLASEYPLYDDDDHSSLELEQADEAWDQYLEYDLSYDLDKALTDDVSDGDRKLVMSAIKEFVYGEESYCSGLWFEDGSSGMAWREPDCDGTWLREIVTKTLGDTALVPE